MTKKRTAPRPSRARGPDVRARLDAAEVTLRAIRNGDVDAVVVAGTRGEHVVTLAGAELAYRILFDQMNEGALTVTPDGVIAYCNRRFADIVRTPLAGVIGAPLLQFVGPAEQAALEALRQGGSRENARGDLRFQAGDGSPVPVSVSFAPLHIEGSTDVIGVVGVIRDVTEQHQQEALRSRLIEQVMTAQDEERRRIARELHDETGQSLIALLVGLRTIEESGTMLEAIELAQRLRGIVAQTLEEVGRLSRGLHPSVLDDVGLAAAVVRHAHESGELHGFAVDVRVDGLGSESLPPLLQATVHRVLQESLTNVARHAGARSVSVRLVRRDSVVELRVQDDGAGFQSGAGGRLGLRGMRERAALLGGSVDVASHPGAGTIITATFPLGGA